MTRSGAEASGTCESCGATGDALVKVCRVYLDTDAQGRVTGSHTIDEPERWCVSCRSLYPHEPAPG
ncbi:MAG: hypothetical protein ACYDD6_05090 [Acidimicrobiales bacterium]